MDDVSRGTSEVERLRARILELEAQIAELEAIIDGDEPPDHAAFVADVRAAVEAKGAEVGTLTGPPIIGTTDSVNAGPARVRG